MSTSTIAALYDALPYLGSERADLDPAHIGAIAYLRGIRMPALRNLRVVEIGCGDGVQLCSFARRFPSAKLVGIDISPQHIARARAACKQEQLEIDFICDDFAKVPRDPASVDLIIAHGIYSYLDQAKANRLLEWSRQALAPQGVCCISFNTLPGWHMRALFGDIAACGDTPAQTPNHRVARARELLSVAERCVQEDPRPEGELLRTGLAQILSASDHYIFHEFIGARSQPLLVSEFARRARDCGLSLFADARYALTYSDDLCSNQLNLPSEWVQRFTQLAPIDRLQIGDFVANTSFRTALLSSSGGSINQSIDLQRVENLEVKSSLRALTPQKDYSINSFEEFATPSGRTLASDDASLRAALHLLEQHSDEWISILELERKVSELTNSAAKIDLRGPLATNLIDFRLIK